MFVDSVMMVAIAVGGQIASNCSSIRVNIFRSPTIRIRGIPRFRHCAWFLCMRRRRRRMKEEDEWVGGKMRREVGILLTLRMWRRLSSPSFLLLVFIVEGGNMGKVIVEFIGMTVEESGGYEFG